MNSLEQLLNEISSQSRIEAIEASFNGSGLAQANHRVKFKGYDHYGRSIVETNGVYLTANNIGGTTPKPDQQVLLRTGKAIRVISF